MMTPPLPSEQLLIDALNAAQGSACLVISPGRGQSAWHAQTLAPQMHVTQWYLDSFRASQAASAAREAFPQIHIACAPDLPSPSVDLVLVSVLRSGEAELTRDLLQQAHTRLNIGGSLWASVNNSNDWWLREQLSVLFKKVYCHSSPLGKVYHGVKTEPLKRIRSFDAKVVFRDHDRLIECTTRPGVFSHRGIDPAARLLVAHSQVQPGEKVLDVGCGCGAVGIAVGLRSGGPVVMIDSNTRAIQCTEQGVTQNHVCGAQVLLNHDGQISIEADIDVALLNPPYYGDFTIAEHFVTTASRYLAPRGRVVIVTKQHTQYLRHAWTRLQLQQIQERSGYQILTYGRRGA